MKTKRFTFIAIALISSVFAEKKVEPDTALISEGLGHIIGRHLEFLEVEFDTALLVKGIQDARTGKESPLPEKDCIEAIHSAQTTNFKKLCEKNLNQAEDFLLNQAKEEAISSLEDGKIQYRVISKGEGLEIKPHSSPLIRYTVKKLDGTVVSIPDQAEPVSLDETIAGLRAGLIGMKEGEKRVLYVHPALGYGEKGGSLFPPNVLLVFEIEVLKADTPK